MMTLTKYIDSPSLNKLSSRFSFLFYFVLVISLCLLIAFCFIYCKEKRTNKKKKNSQKNRMVQEDRSSMVNKIDITEMRIF